MHRVFTATIKNTRAQPCPFKVFALFSRLKRNMYIVFMNALFLSALLTSSSRWPTHVLVLNLFVDAWLEHKLPLRSSFCLCEKYPH